MGPHVPSSMSSSAKPQIRLQRTCASEVLSLHFPVSLLIRSGCRILTQARCCPDFSQFHFYRSTVYRDCTCAVMVFKVLSLHFPIFTLISQLYTVVARAQSWCFLCILINVSKHLVQVFPYMSKIHIYEFTVYCNCTCAMMVLPLLLHACQPTSCMPSPSEMFFKEDTVYTAVSPGNLFSGIGTGSHHVTVLNDARLSVHLLLNISLLASRYVSLCGIQDRCDGLGLSHCWGSLPKFG